jgi:hypothetical protein
VDRELHEAGIGPASGEPVAGCLSAVAGSVVDDPEHAPGRGVGLGGHDLVDEPCEGCDAGLGLAAAEHCGLVYVPGGQILQRAAAVVFVFDAPVAAGVGAQCGVAPDAGLNGGLLVGGDDVVPFAQGLSVPLACVQVQYPAGFGLEVGISGEDPRAVPPGADGVFGQPTPRWWCQRCRPRCRGPRPQPRCRGRGAGKGERPAGTAAHRPML